MGIKDNVRTARAAIKNDIDNGNPLGLADEVREAAIEVILQGMNSVKWERYMALFCDTKDELAQLTVVRNTDESWMPRVRAYLSADAVCFPETGAGFGKGIEEFNVEPPAGSVVPEGTLEPKDIRDNNLFKLLRP